MRAFPYRARLRLAAPLVAVAAVLACADETAVEPAAGMTRRRPMILHFAAGTPPLAANTAGVWVVKGRKASVELRLTSGATFATLDLDQRSLAARPDGTPIAPGDSVLITMSVDGTGAIEIGLAPGGLAFDARHRPRLAMYYAVAGADYDQDGDHDGDDDRTEDRLGLWRQAAPGQPYAPSPGVTDKASKKVVGDLTGFSRYAIAY
jgi:hypothetical protein